MTDARQPFRIKLPVGDPSPIVISIPHCGMEFPEEVLPQYRDPEMLRFPDDTDFFVDRLYEFAMEMNITIISSVYSRWLIDLNRPPDNSPLYRDGRSLTALCPVTSFAGQELYREESIPDQKEIDRRIRLYYEPYHDMLTEILADLSQSHPQVLLWEAHSIRRVVPSIQEEPFPDLILGDNNETSADPDIFSTVMDMLYNSDYQAAHNYPFRGGHITRLFGNPADGCHSLQLEMAKDLYMDDRQTSYSPERAGRIIPLLRQIFDYLISRLE